MSVAGPLKNRVDSGTSPNRAERGHVTRLKPAIRQTLIVIPARDEAADVGDVVRRAVACGFPVVVVDDHSVDATAEVATRAGAEVLRLPFHAGCWAAIQTGMRHALAKGYRHVVTLDADGQHNPEDVTALVAEMDQDNAPSVVIASCPDRANQRRRMAWRVLRWLSGLQISDLTSGFRVYDRSAVELLASSHCTLLEYQDVGVLLKLCHRKLKIIEREVSMRPRSHGRSRIFSSWPVVFYYLAYSCLIGTSRRAPARKHRP